MVLESTEPYSHVLAFDVGGSHISAGFCNLSTLQVDRTAQSDLAADPSCREFVDLVYHLGCEVAGNGKNLAGAAFAVPGPFDHVTGISYMLHKLKSLYGVNLRSTLSERFGWQPQQLRFLNDAGAFLLGEVSSGAARSAKRAVGIVLGTGIGSAFAVDGRCVIEGSGVPPGGEIWNLPYGDGTVEDLLSTRALKLDYANRTGREEDVVSIAEYAATDPDARSVFETFGNHLGRVFHEVLGPFAPDVVVVGGGIARSAHLFLPITQQQVSDKGFLLVTSTLLDRAPLVGAGAFWRDDSVNATHQIPLGPDESGSLADVF